MARKRIYRSDDKIIAGVCGGFAEYLDVDPTIVRLVYVALTIASLGFGVLFYLACWTIIPKKNG